MRWSRDLLVGLLQRVARDHEHRLASIPVVRKTYVHPRPDMGHAYLALSGGCQWWVRASAPAVKHDHVGKEAG